MSRERRSWSWERDLELGGRGEGLIGEGRGTVLSSRFHSPPLPPPTTVPASSTTLTLLPLPLPPPPLLPIPIPSKPPKKVSKTPVAPTVNAFNPIVAVLGIMVTGNSRILVKLVKILRFI